MVTVKHYADLALVPNWVGSQQLRFCKLEGDELFLVPTQPWKLDVSKGLFLYQMQYVNRDSRKCWLVSV